MRPATSRTDSGPRLRLLAGALALSLAVACGPTPRPAQPPGTAPRASAGRSPTIELSFLSARLLPPDDRRPVIDGLRVGGVSACALEPREGLLWVASDDRETPRVFLFRMALGPDGLRLEPVRAYTLEHGLGPAPASAIADLEGLALVPGRGLLVSVEGDREAVPIIDPTIALVVPSRREMRVLPLPHAFVVGNDDHSPRGAASGMRPNAGLESLTYRARDGVVYTGTEQPLLQDDDPPAVGSGARSRLAELVPDGESWQPRRQFVYELDPVVRPADFGPVEGMNGLVELLALDDGALLALERSFVRELAEGRAGRRRTANSIRIYQVWLDGADDVSGVRSLRGRSVRAAEKALVLSLDRIAAQLPPELGRLDNFEGMCAGPTLQDGTRTVVVVSDDNFSAGQRTAFVVLAMTRR